MSVHWKVEGKKIMSQYPQMGPKESQIWTYFLEKIDWDDIEYIEYAVRVGPPYVLSMALSESERRMVEAVTRLRIDAVVHRKSSIWLVEVKEVVSTSAIGQMVSYYHYYVQEHKPMKPVYIAVVAEDYKVAVVDVAKRYGIVIFIAKPHRLIRL